MTNIICESCGAENVVEFANAYDPVTFDIIEGQEQSMFRCWNCNTLFLLGRDKSYSSRTNKHHVVAKSDKG